MTGKSASTGASTGGTTNYAINESQIPWTIVPVDKRWYRNYIMCKTLIEKLETLDMQYPPLPL